MNKQKILAASIVTLFLPVAGISVASEENMNPQNPPMNSSGNMMGSGMMGMKGMMENCPMMKGGMDALSPQQQMQMHAEMMQAMGQIMQKYASQAQPATK